MTSNWIAAAGAGLVALGIILGAFGAHGLQHIFDDRTRQIYEKAVLYHLIDAIGILAIGISLHIGMLSSRGATIAAGLLIVGILIFSGSLYLYSTLHIRFFAMITPIGGVSLIAGWCWLMKELIAGK